MHGRVFDMKTMDEIEEARAVVPYYRANMILSGHESRPAQSTRVQVFELVKWAYGFDTEYDWTFKITCQGASWMDRYPSFVKAKEIVNGWFGEGGNFPLDQDGYDGENLFDAMVLPVLEIWLEEVIVRYETNSTWKGVKGRHLARWDSELGGHVLCLADSGSDKYEFDMQL
jgi:hypothetical protein